MAKRKFLIVDKKGELNQEKFTNFISKIDKTQDILISMIEKDISYEITSLKYNVKSIISLKVLPDTLREANPKLKNYSSVFTLETEQTDAFFLIMYLYYAHRQSYDIFYPALNIFLPKSDDMGLVHNLDLVHNNQLKTFITEASLEPLFQKATTEIYYARNLIDDSIHLINPYIMEFYFERQKFFPSTELSYKVADNLDDFILKVDTGLIPTDFYKYFKKSQKIISYTSFNLEKFDRKVFIKPYIYEIDPVLNEFQVLKKGSSAVLFMDKIRKDESLEDAIIRIVRNELSIASDFLGAVVMNDLEFDFDKENILTPRLVVKVFLEKAELSNIQKQEADRGWVSLQKN